jgi:hypothetical protein
MTGIVDFERSPCINMNAVSGFVLFPEMPENLSAAAFELFFTGYAKPYTL